MKLKFPLQDPRAPGEACASAEELRQRIAAYGAPLLFEIEQFAIGTTGTRERFCFDDASLEKLRQAIGSMFLAFERASIVPTRGAIALEADRCFQSFMAIALGQRRRWRS